MSAASIEERIAWLEAAVAELRGRVNSQRPTATICEAVDAISAALAELQARELVIVVTDVKDQRAGDRCIILNECLVAGGIHGQNLPAMLAWKTGDGNYKTIGWVTGKVKKLD